MNELSELETQENVSQNDINVILENISDVFLSSAEKSFGYVNNKTPVQIKKQPTWYGSQCKIMRRKWHNAKYRYKHNKNDTNKTTLKQASKAYKRTMRQSYTKLKKISG